MTFSMNIRPRIIGSLYFILFLIVGGCNDDDDSNNPFMFGDNCLRGSGAVISETRDLGDFTRIQNSIPADIFITQGPAEPISIEAQANILEQMMTTVSNNTLSISFDDCVEDIDDISIFITIPDITGLTLTGVGNFNTEGAIDVDELDITLTGAGNFNLEGTADILNISLTGVGDVNTFPLNTNICNVNLSGVGNAEVSVNDELDVTITGVGSVFYRGEPVVTTTITGSGSVINSN